MQGDGLRSHSAFPAFLVSVDLNEIFLPLLHASLPSVSENSFEYSKSPTIFQLVILSALFFPSTLYSTIPRNGNPVNGNHLEICLSSPQKNGN